VVRAIIHGEPVQNIDTIATPDALAYFQDRPELAEPAGNPESG